MQADELTDDYIGGTFQAALDGKITGIVRGPGWREVQVDPGVEGSTIVQLRIFDNDPIDFEATTASPVLNPPGESRDPVTGELIPPDTE